MPDLTTLRSGYQYGVWRTWERSVKCHAFFPDDPLDDLGRPRALCGVTVRTRDLSRETTPWANLRAEVRCIRCQKLVSSWERTAESNADRSDP